MRLLVIDDDKEFTQALSMLLKDSFIVDIEYTGREGLYAASVVKYSALLIDLMLADLDGITICRELRTRNIGTPIIVITGNSDKKCICDALDNGADDYIIKPFDFLELISRLRAIIRRKSLNTSTNNIRIKDIEVDLKSKTVTKNNVRVALRRKEYEILEHLLINQNATVTKDSLVESLWDVDSYRESNTLEVHISCLRKALKTKDLIKTIHGLGYRIDK